MADPNALKPADHPFACLLLLENGIDSPNVKASLFCEYGSMDDQNDVW
ncbi:hypothetical protein ABIE26_002440 [Pedobacter africanus]|uniref:Uncharacterized protein n=1 Tax=Pedobacter africanus TaxID=151894 RepID=A0ACC6KYM8_9SPHI|nr:hypothetical protein [Pedobacter africanus]